MIIRAMQSLVAAIRAGYRYIIPKSWRGYDWSAPPMIPGKWRKVAPDTAMTLMIRLCAEEERVAAICASHDIAALRMRRLISVQDALLIEFQAVPHDGGARGIGAFIYRPGLFDVINGRAIVLHRIAGEDAVKLETAKQALEYCQLFCSATQAEDGCFFPAGRGHPNQMNIKHPRFWSSLKQLAAPHNVKSRNDGWAIDMPIAYGSSFFRSYFNLSIWAMIEMERDEHMCGIIPASPQGWQDGLRYNYARNGSALQNPCGECDAGDEEFAGDRPEPSYQSERQDNAE